MLWQHWTIYSQYWAFKARNNWSRQPVHSVKNTRYPQGSGSIPAQSFDCVANQKEPSSTWEQTKFQPRRGLDPWRELINWTTKACFTRVHRKLKSLTTHKYVAPDPCVLWKILRIPLKNFTKYIIIT